MPENKRVEEIRQVFLRTDSRKNDGEQEALVAGAKMRLQKAEGAKLFIEEG